LFGWLSGYHLIDKRDPIIFIGFPFFGIGSFVTCISLIQGTPTLLIDQDGITLRNIFSVRRAAWDSLSLFFYTKINGGGLSIPCLQAEIIGSNVSKNLKRKNKVVIPNIFVSDLREIILILNDR
jgi:hypothetical protein